MRYYLVLGRRSRGGGQVFSLGGGADEDRGGAVSLPRAAGRQVQPVRRLQQRAELGLLRPHPLLEGRELPEEEPVDGLGVGPEVLEQRLQKADGCVETGHSLELGLLSEDEGPLHPTAQ